MATNVKQELLVFLDWVGEKGMMKASTARSLKGACNAVLSVLDEAEEMDLLNVDLESTFQKYENLNGLQVSPGTMRAYRQRVRYAIEEFGKYNENKSTWKPSGGRRSTQSSSQPWKPRGGEHKKDAPNENHKTDANYVDVSTITHHFPLRRDAVVTISGIPFDVKRSEMARLTAFISNLVATPEEDLPPQPMLNSSPERVG